MLSTDKRVMCIKWDAIMKRVVAPRQKKSTYVMTYSPGNALYDDNPPSKVVPYAMSEDDASSDCGGSSDSSFTLKRISADIHNDDITLRDENHKMSESDSESDSASDGESDGESDREPPVVKEYWKKGKVTDDSSIALVPMKRLESAISRGPICPTTVVDEDTSNDPNYWTTVEKW